MSHRILVVDDHALIRQGLRMLIDAEPDMKVIGEAASGPAALEAIAALAPDVVIMDIEMPGENGIEVARQALAAAPTIKIIMLSAFPDDEYVTETVRIGVKGYLLKGNPPLDVLKAIRAVADGQTFMCPEAASALVSALRSKLHAEALPPAPVLSPREREILSLVATGLRTKEIASRLDIGVKTVDTHRARMMKKLKCGSTAELVRYAIREGLVS